jgi:hypothetical protein
LCEHEKRQLELRCASFGCWFPTRFPDSSLPPKFHILIVHVPQFAGEWHSVGVASEQVIESMNRVVNSMHAIFRTMPASNRTILKAMAGRIAFVQDKRIVTIKRKQRMCPRCSLPIAKKKGTVFCLCDKSG